MVFIPDNDTTGKMQHRLIIFDFLSLRVRTRRKRFIQLCVHPPASFKISAFNCFRLFFPLLDMRFVTTAFQICLQPFGFIVFVHTKAAPVCLRSAESIGNQLYIVGICPCGYQREGGAVRICHQTAFYALFTPFCRVATCFLSQPAVISLYSHPSRAMSGRWSPVVHRPATRSARTVQKTRRHAIPGNDDGPSLMSKFLSHSAHSTDNQC